MLERGTLGGAAQAYLHGLVATATPWLLTVAFLGGLRLLFHNQSELVRIEQAVTLIYALTIVLSAPVQVVLSRYVADRIYEGRLDQIGAPITHALTAALGIAPLVGVALMFGLALPMPLAVRGVALTAVVTAQWLLLAVAAGMWAPSTLLGAYGLGMLAGVLSAVLFASVAAPAAIAYVDAFLIGQVVTVLLLLRALFRALPSTSDESARLLPAFAEYWALAVAALAGHGAIWADKVLIWATLGSHAALTYSAVTSSAWFSVIPAATLLFVRVETRFYARFSAFYEELLDGATPAELRRGVAWLGAEVRELLSEVALVQVGVTLTGLAAAPQLLAVFGLPPQMRADLRLLLVGAALQQIMLCSLLLLYYFDRRGAALELALVGLVANLTATGVCVALHRPPAWGNLIGAGIAAGLGLLQTRRAIRQLLVDTFQSQPYGMVRDA